MNPLTNKSTSSATQKDAVYKITSIENIAKKYEGSDGSCKYSD